MLRISQGPKWGRSERFRMGDTDRINQNAIQIRAGLFESGTRRRGVCRTWTFDCFASDRVRQTDSQGLFFETNPGASKRSGFGFLCSTILTSRALPSSQRKTIRHWSYMRILQSPSQIAFEPLQSVCWWINPLSAQPRLQHAFDILAQARASTGPACGRNPGGRNGRF